MIKDLETPLSKIITYAASYSIGVNFKDIYLKARKMSKLL